MMRVLAKQHVAVFGESRRQDDLLLFPVVVGVVAQLWIDVNLYTVGLDLEAQLPQVLAKFQKGFLKPAPQSARER